MLAWHSDIAFTPGVLAVRIGICRGWNSRPAPGSRLLTTRWWIEQGGRTARHIGAATGLRTRSRWSLDLRKSRF